MVSGNQIVNLCIPFVWIPVVVNVLSPSQELRTQLWTECQLTTKSLPDCQAFIYLCSSYLKAKQATHIV
jgi:hypothetical protein